MVLGCDHAGCGCYFGIAVCKCEQKTITIKRPTVNAFGTYAYQSGSQGLLNVHQVLMTMTEDSQQYAQFILEYQKAIEELSAIEKQMLENFLQ
jgi:hypothetical protein